MSSTIRNCALNFLARREHTKLELQRKLNAKGFAANNITEAIDKLEKQGLQSDERFLESYVAMRCKRGFGPIRITKELCERGIDQELIDRFLLDYVVDFLDFHIGNSHFPAFNIADSAISIAAVLLIVDFVMHMKSNSKEPPKK